jgi:hypothetical protein
VQKIPRTQNSDDANQNPKRIQHDISGIAFERGTPGKHHGIGRIENPDKHERTVRPEPTDQAETENPHQDTNHFDDFQPAQDKHVYLLHLFSSFTPFTI